MRGSPVGNGSGDQVNSVLTENPSYCEYCASTAVETDQPPAAKGVGRENMTIEKLLFPPSKKDGLCDHQIYRCCQSRATWPPS